MGAFLGMDIFNIKNTFTDISDDENNNDNKKDKSETNINKEDKKDNSEPVINKDYRAARLAREAEMYKKLMEHNEQIFNWQREEAEKGTENLVEDMDSNMAEVRADDTKALHQIIKSLNDINITDESKEGNSDNKRSISEEENENKKAKIENKRSRED